MASPSTWTQDYHANPETPLSTDNAVRRATMHDLFGSSTESENSMENEVTNEDDGNSYEDQIEEDQDENMEDEEDLFGVDKHACEEMMKNGPQSGLEFESKERLFASYQAFAKVVGFSILTRNARINKYLMLMCGRGRKPNVKKFSNKTDCPARLNAIKQDNGNWKISKVCKEHNHDLEPQLSEFMPAHRHLSTNLKVHLEAYDRAGLRPYKIRKELQAEYSTKCRPITCASEFKWESQFAKVYTNTIMELFQKEVKKIWNCNLILLEADGSVMDRYDITETCTLSKHSSSNELHFIVEHRPVGGYFECNCKEFESKGAYPHMSKEYKLFQEMECEFIKCSDMAIDSGEDINFVKDKLKEIQRDLKRRNRGSSTTLGSPNSSQAIEIDGGDIPILDPVIVTRKGRPRTARFKDPAENRKGRGRGRGRSGRRGPSESCIM
ncbi:protein FAR-RED IMPAIRED RESPONSE 1-like [Salvia divinorum]|uniref:Protein FAR1-RELATED SEQUENCE n=1 Tax=Salvia divinorum TaxID=28513 RepID=A0ABD1HZI0_SALDI